MAEYFFCSQQIVSWTNGGGYQLFIGWYRCAEYLGYIDLSRVLMDRIQYGAGCIATGIDEEYLDERLQIIEMKKQWLNTMDCFIKQVSTNGFIAKSLDINWHDELKKYWLKRLGIMRKSLKQQIANSNPK